MARALVRSAEVEPLRDEAGVDQLRYRINVLFYGAGVIDATTQQPRIDSDMVTVTFPPPQTALQVQAARASIRAAIQASATALGYGTLEGRTHHADEILHQL